MKNMISIADYSVDEINEIFSIADELSNNKYKDILNGKNVVMFFPENSIRTRVSFEKCRVTKAVMDKANKGALLNPCPPFYRGKEVSEDVINSKYFVGYKFKKSLLVVQQAIIVYCLTR